MGIVMLDGGLVLDWQDASLCIEVCRTNDKVFEIHFDRSTSMRGLPNFCLTGIEMMHCEMRHDNKTRGW